MRASSPPSGFSILITSAPMSAMSTPASGPANAWPTSMTLTPSKGKLTRPLPNMLPLAEAPPRGDGSVLRCRRGIRLQRLPEPARAEPVDRHPLGAMAGTGRGAGTSRRATQEQRRRECERGDQRCLARLFRRVACLLLGVLQFRIGVVDPLLGLGLWQAGLLLHCRHQGSAIASVELAALERCGPD